MLWPLEYALFNAIYSVCVYCGVGTCSDKLLLILQDLEGEAVQLRSQKKPVTDRAQMLLQVLSVSDTPIPPPLCVSCVPSTLQILMEFMHHKNEGLPLDILTGSSVSIQ